MWTVKNDVDELRAAIVYPGGMEIVWATSGWTADYPMLYDVMYTGHKSFIEEMKEFHEKVKIGAPSANLFHLKDLLQETLDEYGDDKSMFKKIVTTCFPFDWPRVEKLLGNRLADLTADQIFGRDCPLVKDATDFKIGIRPLVNIYKVADLGQMTDNGLIIGNKSRWMRSREEAILRAVVENHPVMKENVNVYLDLGTKKDCYMEGGDVAMPSGDSIAIGIRCNTNREACKEISKALPDKTIYAVLKYPEELYSAWSWHYAWHLNQMFRMLDEGKALIAPYIFDHPKGGRKLILKLLETLNKDFEKYEPLREESELRTYKEAGKKPPEELKRRIFGDLTKERITALGDVGGVEIYKKGKRVATKDSFIDALIQDGILEPDKIIYVGGDPEDIDYRTEVHYYYNALREGGWACCVATVKSGVVIAYDDMFKTNETLKDHGVKTITIDGRYMRYVGQMGLDTAILPLWRGW